MVQEFMSILLTANERTDGRTDSHSDYSADPRVAQFDSYTLPDRHHIITSEIFHCLRYLRFYKK